VDYLVDLAATYLRRLEVAVIAGKACLNAARQTREAPAPSSATTTTPPPTADDRCQQIDARLGAASQAGDLATFRALLAQGTDCGFYPNAAAWLERNDRCTAIGQALAGAAQARDLARFRGLLGQAADCDFHEKAAADLAALERDDRCNAIGAALAAAVQARDLNRFRGLLAQATDCDYYQQASADLARLENDRRQEALSTFLNGVTRTLQGLQRQGPPPAPVPPTTTATPPRQPAPPNAGPQVSEAEKKAVEDEINRRYEAWKKRWCTPSWSGCVLYPSGTRAALVEKYLWNARTSQDVQRVRALFQCYDPCVMQDLKTEQAYEQCQRQCRTAVLGEP
jgi:hypothetical protein